MCGFIGLAVNAQAVETLRPEDEKLLEGVLTDTHVTVKRTETPTVEPEFDADVAEDVFFEEVPLLEEPAEEPIRNIGEIKAPVVPIDKENIETYRTKIAACLDLQKEQLDLETDMLYKGNIYDDTAYLTQTMTKVNLCYQSIGFEIIDEFYQGSDKIRRKYEEKSQTFFVKANDMNPKYCEDNCSVAALVKKQQDKFADFRTYLAELIAQRPRGL